MSGYQNAKISERGLRALPEDGIINDTEVKGLRARRRKEGGAIRFEFRRQYKGQRHFSVIGEYGELTIAQARDEAEQLWSAIKRGQTPGDIRDHEAATSITVEELCARFMSEFVEHKRKKHTVVAYRSAFKNHITPNIGKLRASQVTPERMYNLHLRLERDLPFAAKQSILAFSACWSWAVKSGALPRDAANPCKGLDLAKKNPRQRILRDGEVRRLGDALRAAEAWADPWALAALHFILISGWRKGEVLSLQWDWIHRDIGRVMMPDSKTGQKQLPLTPPLIALLDKVERYEGSPYVFPSPDTPRTAHRSSIERLWTQIREDADLKDVRLHDLRRTFISSVARAGGSIQMAQALAGHKNIQTTQGYAYLFADDVSRIADATAQHVSETAGLMIEGDASDV